MMYSCAPRSSASTTTVKGRKGKSLKIDLHCHYANPAAAARVAERNPGQYEPNVKYANALTRETNVRQMHERAPKLSSIEVRLPMRAGRIRCRLLWRKRPSRRLKRAGRISGPPPKRRTRGPSYSISFSACPLSV